MSLNSQCEIGCMIYHGGEIRHHRNCAYYPESLTEMHHQMQDEIKKLQAENKELLTGFKGACYCCEPVGELNKKLQAKIEIYEEVRAFYADKNNWYGQDLASSEGRHARECGEKIKAIDNE